MYDAPTDPPNKKNQASFEENSSVWSALANTERWISETLNRAGVGNAANNPYSRKEVNYDCEYSDALELVVAGIFRRLREVRELGQSHADVEKERKEALG